MDTVGDHAGLLHWSPSGVSGSYCKHLGESYTCLEPRSAQLMANSKAEEEPEKGGDEEEEEALG